MHLSLEKEANFPNLRRGNYRVTSEEDPVYNCIAHAAGRDDGWWWPVDGIDGVVWPGGLERKETLECFVSAYALQGYVCCESGKFEAGFEKVAIYADSTGEPTHAARQLRQGDGPANSANGKTSNMTPLRLWRALAAGRRMARWP
jgi:hypothetical protein